jgi:hypothetical protein
MRQSARLNLKKWPVKLQLSMPPSNLPRFQTTIRSSENLMLFCTNGRIVQFLLVNPLSPMNPHYEKHKNRFGGCCPSPTAPPPSDTPIKPRKRPPSSCTLHFLSFLCRAPENLNKKNMMVEHQHDNYYLPTILKLPEKLPTVIPLIRFAIIYMQCL